MTSVYGIRVSKPGKDVKTATGDDLIMDVDSTMLKVFASGTVTMKSSDGTHTISHNLGYIPHFLVYGSDGTSIYLGTGVKPIVAAPVISAWADTSNVYFYVGSSTNVPVYYYIFYDQT